MGQHGGGSGDHRDEGFEGERKGRKDERNERKRKEKKRRKRGKKIVGGGRPKEGTAAGLAPSASGCRRAMTSSASFHPGSGRNVFGPTSRRGLAGVTGTSRLTGFFASIFPPDYARSGRLCRINPGTLFRVNDISSPGPEKNRKQRRSVPSIEGDSHGALIWYLYVRTIQVP